MPYDVKTRKLAQPALFEIRGPLDSVTQRCGPHLPAFPMTPNTRTAADDIEVYWLGRRRWLLRAPAAEEERLEGLFAPESVPADMSVVLVSDSYIFFEISGPGADQVMAIATPLDFGRAHPDAACFTQAFGIRALFIKRRDRYEFAFERSFEEMIEDCLARALG